MTGALTEEEEGELRGLLRLQQEQEAGGGTLAAGQPWHAEPAPVAGRKPRLEYTPAAPPPPPKAPASAVPKDLDWSEAAPVGKEWDAAVDAPRPGLRQTEMERGFKEIGETQNLESLTELHQYNKAAEAERREAEMKALEALGWALAVVEPGPGGEAYLASRAGGGVAGVGGRAAGAAAGQTGRQAGKRLFWHGSPEAVARREAEGVFVDGAGNGGLNWATQNTRDNLGPLAWKVGGNHDVTWRPPFVKNKGGLEATYELTPEEVAQFRRAWGPDFNWNAYQWYKGLAGQYYYRPKPATAGQRLKELGQAAGITGAALGGGYGVAKLMGGERSAP